MISGLRLAGILDAPVTGIPLRALWLELARLQEIYAEGTRHVA
jgi:hypothetical protein